jgi:two-component system, OmpR family, heavy metal sensor histidine kinase CusS
MQSSVNKSKQGCKIDLFPADEDFTVLADKNHLAIVLNNLIINAIKYGLLNSVIRISITKHTGGISLSIQNKTDLIIDDVNKLKNEFKRADFYKDGFGLGLWIADQLIKKNDGKLSLSFFDKIFTAEIKFGKRNNF